MLYEPMGRIKPMNCACILTRNLELLVPWSMAPISGPSSPMSVSTAPVLAQQSPKADLLLLFSREYAVVGVKNLMQKS